MTIEWIEYEGSKILYIDYRSFSTADAMIAQIYASVKYEIANPGILEIADFRGVKIPLEFVDVITEVGQKHRNNYVKRCAVIGINGVKRFMYKTYCNLSGDKTTRTFTSKDEALTWLISDAANAGGNPRFCRQEEILS